MSPEPRSRLLPGLYDIVNFAGDILVEVKFFTGEQLSKQIYPFSQFLICPSSVSVSPGTLKPSRIVWVAGLFSKVETPDQTRAVRFLRSRKMAFVRFLSMMLFILLMFFCKQ